MPRVFSAQLSGVEWSVWVCGWEPSVTDSCYTAALQGPPGFTDKKSRPRKNIDSKIFLKTTLSLYYHPAAIVKVWGRLEAFCIFLKQASIYRLLSNGKLEKFVETLDQSYHPISCSVISIYWQGRIVQVYLYTMKCCHLPVLTLLLHLSDLTSSHKTFQ